MDRETLKKIGEFIKENRMQLTNKELLILAEDIDDFLREEKEPECYFTDNLLLYINGEDLFESFTEYIETKINLSGKKVLDIACGRHCLSAAELTAKGAIVTAMDPYAKPAYNNGFSVRVENFEGWTSLTEIDLVTAVRAGDCLVEIIMASLRDKKKFAILLPKGNKVEKVRSLCRFSGVKVEILSLSIPYIIVTNL